jgi:lipoate-protein ligase A
VQRSGPAGDLHAESAGAISAPTARLVRVLEAEGRALVLGSHQPDDHFDPDALERGGVALARRRSGGGAVLVGAGEVLWVDVVVPAGDARWDEDVRRAGLWVGEAWAAALREVVPGSAPVEVWAGGLRRTEWSDAICFAGLGPGEVTVGGRKVVGLSQRRTKWGALFQTAVLLSWRPQDYLTLMAGRRAGEPVPARLADCAEGIGEGAGADLLTSFLDGLVT